MLTAARPTLALVLAASLSAGICAGCGGDEPADWQLRDDFRVGELEEIARCREHRGEQASYFYANPGFGDWVVALPAAITDWTDLDVAGANSQNRLAAAVYDAQDAPVTGAIFSAAVGADAPSPTRLLAARRASIAAWASVEEASETASFSTHDGREAATGSYIMRLGEAASTEELRDALLFSMAPFSRADVSNLPAASGARRRAFRLQLTTITSEQPPLATTTLALAPLAAHGGPPAEAGFLLDDLTNTTNQARAGANHALRCGVFAAEPAARYTLGQAPITSTLRVELAGRHVPRSRLDGWDYHPQSNAIELFGEFRDRAKASQSVELRLSFETFLR